MSSWHSYPSIFHFGHRALAEFFADPVLVEEKVDGSQFSFGVFEDGLRIRSKGMQMQPDAPEKMFTEAAKTAVELAPQLHPGWTYRGEYLRTPKHNTLAYDRVPAKNVILFDIDTEEATYLSYDEKVAEAARLGLEVVPRLFEGKLTNVGDVLQLMDRMSVLGGQKIEGFVAKNYAKFGADKKVLMAKHVSEAFKEIHKGAWRESNPTRGDIVQQLILELTTPARWQKAVQHLREAGQLEQSPRDIGNLIKEVQADIKKECSELIAERLVRWAQPHILRAVVHGLPEWYKTQLLEAQFGTTDLTAAAPCAQPAHDDSNQQ